MKPVFAFRSTDPEVHRYVKWIEDLSASLHACFILLLVAVVWLVFNSFTDVWWSLVFYSASQVVKTWWRWRRG